MRWTPFISAILAGSAFASDPGMTRWATDAEADFIYLTTLNSQSGDESMQMLTDVGIDPTRARELLTYLDEHIAARNQQAIADTARLCRNPEGRFSSSPALARELQRQEDAQDDFAAETVHAAEAILGVTSLAPVWSPHMNRPGLWGPNAVDLVRQGQIEPADAIRRACEVTKDEQARIPDEGEAL